MLRYVIDNASIYCQCKIKLSIENQIVIKYVILISYGNLSEQCKVF